MTRQAEPAAHLTAVKCRAEFTIAHPRQVALCSAAEALFNPVPEESRMKSPRWSVVFGVACAVVAVATALAPDEARETGGTWVVESTSRDKELAAPWKGSEWGFAKDIVTVKWPRGRELTFPFTVDPAKMPKAMDFAPPKKSKQEPWPMIYELDGDSLKLCIGSGDKRPAKFTDKDGFIVVLKRKK